MDKIFKSAKEAFEYTQSSIKVYDKKERTSLAFRILEHFNISRTHVLSQKEIIFTGFKELNEIIERINRSEPLQYILGETEFYGRKFYVSKNVLIPRPETEELVDRVIKENKGKKGLKILDIGTGSGCIPITLAKELPDSEVYSIDISEEALEIARKNSALYSAGVEFSIFDIIQNSNPKDGQAKLKIENLDILISNPPYVTESEKKEMHENVLDFEPHIALFVPDANPLLFYSEILNFAQQHLKPGGKCYFEINENFGKEVAELMGKRNFKNIEIIRDLNGKNRFAYGKLLK